MSKLIKKTFNRFQKFQKGGYVTKTKENSYYSPEQQQNAVDKGYDFVNNWYKQRKATGRFNDQLTDEQMQFQKDKAANTKVFYGNLGDTAIATTNIAGPNNTQIGVMRLSSENVKPQWGIDWQNDKNLVTNSIYGWTNILNTESDRVSPAINKVSEITGNKKDASGTYSKLMQMRHYMNANPKANYTLDQLKGYLKQFALPADETGVRLMNEVADNRISTSNNYVPGQMSISRNGSKLVKKYVNHKK